MVCRTLALFLSFSVARPAGAAEDAPLIVHQTDGKYLLNESAYAVLDTEVRRLQEVERVHKEEQWVPVLLVGFGVGLLTAIPLSLFFARVF